MANGILKWTYEQARMRHVGYLGSTMAFAVTWDSGRPHKELERDGGWLLSTVLPGFLPRLCHGPDVDGLKKRAGLYLQAYFVATDTRPRTTLNGG